MCQSNTNSVKHRYHLLKMYKSYSTIILPEYFSSKTKCLQFGDLLDRLTNDSDLRFNGLKTVSLCF